MESLDISSALRRKISSRKTRLDGVKKRGGLYWITDEDGNEVCFTRNDVQQAMMTQVWYWNIILKGRQHGISTLILLLMLDTSLFFPNTHCGLVDATLPDATKKLDKARFAYERLLPELRKAVPLKSDNATSLEFGNGSRIDVGTSHRGGTLQILHVSEMGKIAAETPKRSKEIRSGAFGTAHRGSTVFVESTAAGAAGDFFELVQEADAVQRQGLKLSEQEFKLIFLPWQIRKQYRTDPDGVLIPKELAEYFEDLEQKHGVKLDAQQRAWYALQRKKIGPDDMWREYPSYPEEAFKVSLEGAYFKTQMTKLREQRRIGHVPLDPSRPVHTCWDIGKDDNTAIWFFQAHGQMVHFVHYYENSGEGVEFYARKIKEIAEQRGFVYGRHYGPHDLDNSHWILPGSDAIVDVARRVGIDFIVVPRIPNKQDAIEAMRNWLVMAWIDEEHCAQGIRCLDNYTKEWDDKHGHYKSEPLHNWASHGADAGMTGACGFTPDYVPPPTDRYAKPKTRGSAWAA
jgi:hypothetical protein